MNHEPPIKAWDPARESLHRPEPGPTRGLGATGVIRPLGPEDELRLREFFQSHSQETIQSRYGYMMGTMTHERAYALVNVDQHKDVALGVFEKRDEVETLQAVGRYYTESAPGTAEIAFVVRESRQGGGLATHLLCQLAGIARAHGVITFRAQVLRTNHAMRHILDRYHPEVSPLPGCGWLMYVLAVESIPAAPEPSVAGRSPRHSS